MEIFWYDIPSYLLLTTIILFFLAIRFRFFSFFGLFIFYKSKDKVSFKEISFCLILFLFVFYCERILFTVCRQEASNEDDEKYHLIFQ